MDDRLYWYISSQPMMAAEGVKKQIETRRDVRLKRMEAEKLAVKKSTDEVKEALEKVLKTPHDEEACFEVQRAEDRMVCDVFCSC